MKRVGAVAVAIGVLVLVGCGGEKAAPSTEEEKAACMEAEGYPLDKPANEVEGFTMEGMRAAAEKCGLDED